jgi:hypothetical protein
MTWNTGSSPAGEELMTCSTSAVAFCCSSASSRSRLNSATFLFRSAADDSRWCATFGAVRRFGVAAFWRRDLTDAEPALERRRMAHPKAQDYADFKVGLQQGFATCEMGFGVGLHGSILSRSCPLREVKVASEPDALLQVLRNPAYRFRRIGLEAGPLSQWLFSALAEAGLPVICVETRHMRAVLKAQINKTDRNDARGIAQMMRAGLYRPVHVKTLRSQKLRMLLVHRKLLQSKSIAIENDLRGTLRNFGLKVGVAGTAKFEARIKELVENLPDLAALVEPLLVVRRVLREQIAVLHRRLLAIVRNDEVCRRLMTTPGVGPVVALT